MATYSKHYLAGWKWAQAKAKSAKGSFIWDNAAPNYLKKLGMEGWLDSDKYSLSDIAREHTRKAKEIAEEFEAGANAAFDDWRDYKRYEGRYVDRESGDSVIRTPNSGIFSQSSESAARELTRYSNISAFGAADPPVSQESVEQDFDEGYHNAERKGTDAGNWSAGMVFDEITDRQGAAEKRRNELTRRLEAMSGESKAFKRGYRKGFNFYAMKEFKRAMREFKRDRQSNSGIFSQSSEEQAKELARDFHGRDNKGVKEYTLASYYPKDLAELGILIELQVFADDDNGEYIPINFAPEHPDLTDDETNVVLAAKDKQLYFIGGDQEYDIEEFAESAGFDWPDEALEKDEVVLGQVKAIAYFADKHHLEGPKEQKTGIPYQHEFAVNEETGEQIGEYPTLVYCQKDKVFKLVGGSYEILPEGISG